MSFPHKSNTQAVIFREKLRTTLKKILIFIIPSAIAIVAAVISTRPDDTIIRAPRVVYIKADKLLSVDSVDGEAIDLYSETKITEIVRTTNLPYSFVGVILISVSNDVPAENLKIPYVFYATDHYDEYRYSSQNDIITRESGEKCVFEIKSLAKDGNTLAIPFCITQPIIDISIDQLNSDYFNSCDHIIAEYDLNEIQYNSSSRSNQSKILQFFFPPSKVFFKLIEPMQDIKFFIYDNEE